MQLTMTEKIFAAHAKEKSARAGEIVTVRPDVVMLNDISGPLAFDPFRAVGCVIAASFARIFYRNAINIGLPLITCPDFARDAENGHSAQIDMASGRIDYQNRIYQGEGLPDAVRVIVEAGGLIPYARQKVLARGP